MAISIGEIQATLSLRDQLTPQLKIAAGQLSEMGDRMSKVGSQVRELGSSLTIGITLPLAAAGTAALKFSTDFQTVMTKVGTLTDIGANNIGAMSDAVKKMAPSVGIGPTALGEGLLVVASTGIKGATALDILEKSAKASAVGLGDTKDIARAVTSAMTAYGVKNLDAAAATNKLFVAVRAGGAEASEFAGTLGRVVGIASQVGVSFDEVLASIATFTRLGVDASEATTALRGTMSILLHPTQQAREQLEALGTSMTELRKNVREKGLAQAMTDLVELAKGDEDAIGAIIPNVRALAGIMGTAGAQATAYAANLKEVQGASDDLDKAFKVVSETQQFKWNQAMAEGQKLLIQFGDAIAPTFMSFLNAARPVVGLLSDMIKMFDSLPGPVKTFSIAMAAIATIAGPSLYFLGNMIDAVGKLQKAMALFAGTNTAIGMANSLKAIGTAASGSTPFLLGLSAAMGGAVLGGAIAVAMNRADNLNKELGAIGTAAQNSGPHFNSFGKEVLSASASLKQVAADSKSLGASMEVVLPPLAGIGAGAEATANNTKALSTELAEAKRAVAGFSAETKNNIQAGLKLGQSADEIAKRMKLGAGAVHMYVDAVEEAGRKSKKAAEEHDRWVESIRTFGTYSTAVVTANGQIIRSIAGGVIPTLQTYKSEIDGVLQYGNDYSRELTYSTIATDHFGKVIKSNVLPSLQGLGDALAQAELRAAASTSKIAKMNQVLGGVEDVLGGVQTKWAQMATVAVRAIEGISTSLATGNWIGAIVAAGAAFVGFIGQLRKSEETLKVSPMRDAFFEAAGGLEKLNPLVQELTGSLDLVQAVFDAKTVEKYDEALAGLRAGIKEYMDELIAAKDAVASRISGLIQLTPQLQAALERAYDADTPMAYKAALQEINGVMDEQAKKEKFLTDTMEKYGITWDQLGEKARNARLAEMASGITDEFEVLRQAGVDVNVVMRGMGDDINDVVNAAAKSGAEVPESFRRIIQTAIDAGEVFSVNTEELERLRAEAKENGKTFDESGLKIKSMAELGLTFGTTMQESTKRVGEAITGLNDVLGRLTTFLESRIPAAARSGAAVVRREFEDVNATLAETEYHAEGIAHGHSPGGFDGIARAANKAGETVKSFALGSNAALSKTEDRVKSVASTLINMKMPAWVTNGEAKSAFTDISREIKNLQTENDFAQRRNTLKFQKQDEVAEIKANKKLTKPARENLLKLVDQKYALLLQEVAQDEAEARRRVIDDAARDAKRMADETQRLRDTFSDLGQGLTRELALLEAPNEFSKERLNLGFQQEDETRELRQAAAAAGMDVAPLLAMITRKYAIKLEEITRKELAAASSAMSSGNVLSEPPSRMYFHKGTDEVPAMLKGGEAVLNKSAAKALGRGAISSLNSGDSSGVTDISALKQSIDNLAAQQARDARSLPHRLSVAVTDKRNMRR